MKNKKTPKQNKHNDPFFRAKIRSKTKKAMMRGTSWKNYCKERNIDFPKEER